MSDVGSPPSGSCVVTKGRNVDTRYLGRPERVAFDTEIECGSTVEAQWKHATRSVDRPRSFTDRYVGPQWMIGCKMDVHCTQGVEGLEKEHAK